MQIARDISHHDSYNSLWSHTREVLYSVGLPGTFTLNRLHGGANNRVFRVDLDDKKLLLKFYFRHPDDQRDRLGTEFGFLEFAWSKGLRCIPKPLGLDRKFGLGLYEYVEGALLSPCLVGEAEINQAARFISLLNENKFCKEAKALPIASEACFSFEQHRRLIENRIKRFEGSEFITLNYPEIANFVRSELQPAWEQAILELQRKIELFGIDSDRCISVDEECVSPSDFGFHNALVGFDGRLLFFDFEYAGWDDPAKLICDFFCQPKVPAPLEYYKSFVSKAFRDMTELDMIVTRATLLLPLYCLKWCCISLNEFLPEGKSRRQFSDAEKLSSDLGWDKILEQARQLLQKAFLS